MSKPYFQLKGGLFTLTVLYLQSTDLKSFELALMAKISESPDFFQQLPIIIDLSQLPEDSHHLDFNWLKNLLVSQDIIPVALHNIPDQLKAKAQQSDWGIFPNIQPRYEKNCSKLIKTEETAVASSEIKSIAPLEESKQPPEEATVKIITTPIRSGQQVYSTGDLIIINTVNTGAEVLADGNIHVYGALKGRALAGVKGDTTARIFCQSLDAELISIAGKYKVIESIDINTQGKTVQIYLDKGDLKIDSLHKDI